MNKITGKHDPLAGTIFSKDAANWAKTEMELNAKQWELLTHSHPLVVPLDNSRQIFYPQPIQEQPPNPEPIKKASD